MSESFLKSPSLLVLACWLYLNPANSQTMEQVPGEYQEICWRDTWKSSRMRQVATHREAPRENIDDCHLYCHAVSCEFSVDLRKPNQDHIITQMLRHHRTKPDPLISPFFTRFMHLYGWRSRGGQWNLFKSSRDKLVKWEDTSLESMMNLHYAAIWMRNAIKAAKKL